MWWCPSRRSPLAIRPYESRVASEASKLDRPSRLVANQVRTVARERIAGVLGHIGATGQESLDRALRVQLGLL